MKNIYVEVNAYSTISVNFLSTESAGFNYELTEVPIDTSSLTVVL